MTAPKPILSRIVALAVALAIPSAARADEGRPPYGLDPITDTILIGVSFVSGLGSELTIQSGELPASTPGPIDNIPFYDRWVAHGNPQQSGGLLSNVGAILAIGYGVFDSVHTGFQQGAKHGWTEAAMYLEAGLINWTLVNVVKLAIRRPRPVAYAEAQQGDVTDINRDLSFYSGHAALAGSITGTASYLIFAKEGGSAHAWTVFAVGTALTTFVGINRVLAHSHFPSDVFVGAMVGASIGVLVPHFHRLGPDAPKLSVFADQQGGGGVLTMQF